jgi:hypothetical protein
MSRERTICVFFPCNSSSERSNKGASEERKVEENVIAKQANSVLAVGREKVREQEDDMVSSCGCVDLSSHTYFL